MKVYIIVYLPELKYAYETLDSLELVAENKIVDYVKDMIADERIDPDTLEDNNYDIENMTPEMAVKILKDDGYTVEDHDI